MTPRPTEILVESRRPGSHAGSSFLNAARYRCRAGASVAVFLIDDGVHWVLSGRSQLRRISEAGASVWADDSSLAQHGISTTELESDVMPADLGKLAPFLFDPAVRVVWH